MVHEVDSAFGLLYAVFLWLIAGFVIGLLARFILPGPDPAGLWKTVLYGVIGSLVGGLVARLMGLTGMFGFVPVLAVAIFAVWLNRKHRHNVAV